MPPWDIQARSPSTHSTACAMENMLLTGQKATYPNVTMIFPHGGGAMPYLAGRIAGVTTLDALGALNPVETISQLKSYYFDTASAYSAIQLQALKAFGGIGRIFRMCLSIKRGLAWILFRLMCSVIGVKVE
ncbi:hypothetical protein N8T08_003775 [Aspergillus melleus]|uniref:Uncharacterized protein n=1 Tax=Aspergillus melleus TaxID=138277 RepID=A0ACC3B6G1_9EURO|nr:hypothetical protein N8T08_003775 [Aspergillus melleus]